MSVSFNIVGFVDRRTDELKERGEAIEHRRTESLKPITIKPITRPQFRNTHIRDYGQWSVMNLQALADYWNELMSPEGAGPLGEDDFFIFCRIQHERELDHVEELRRCYGSNGDRV